jgi:nucleotide-binding universal stress UspA family protein
MKILVAYDGSTHADRMLQGLVERLGWFSEEATLTVAYVHVPVPYPGALAAVGEDATQRYYDEVCDAVLGQARALLDGRGIRYEVLPRVGDPASTLVDLAQQRGYDLIAMGTHGRGALMGMLMGSVATHILAMTRLPVLLLH